MIGDYGRETSVFSVAKGDDACLPYAGRPVLASDLVNSQEVLTYQREQALKDVIGRVGVPKTGGGFALQTRAGGGFQLSAGDIYVEGARFQTPEDIPFPSRYISWIPDGQKGVVIAHCDKTVYDHLEAPFLRDPGLGGPDTSARRRPFLWGRVWLLDQILQANGMTEAQFCTAMERGETFRVSGLSPQTGRAAFGLDPAHIPDDDDCLISDGAGYTGQGNFNYHVEIHSQGRAGQATFKWAREDVRARLRQVGSNWMMEGAPVDDHRRIRSGDTVEVNSERLLGQNRKGILCQITVNPDETVSFSTSIAGLSGNLILRRWDHAHVGNEDGIPITSGAHTLEKGIQVRFSGFHIVGDYWYCAARMATGDIMWPPREEDALNGFVPSFNWGPQVAALGIFTRDGDQIKNIKDLRPPFPQLTRLRAEDVKVDDTSTCHFTGDTVQDALEDLCARDRQDTCAITVRPDGLGPNTREMHPNWAQLPTLEAALEQVKEFLEKLPVPQGDSSDNERYARRLSLEFTAGDYTWPRDMELRLADLYSVSLTACKAAPVHIRCHDWLAFDRCMNVQIEDIQLNLGPSSGLSIHGGKSITMSNVLVRRSYQKDSAVVRLGARRRITLRETRVLVDDVRGISGVRPALHLWETNVQTLLENVMSNGSLIIGAFLPDQATIPEADLINASTQGEITSTLPMVRIGPGAVPHKSGCGLRIVGSKLYSIVPGAVTVEKIKEWVGENRAGDRQVKLFDPSNSLTLLQSIVGPEHKATLELSEQIVSGGVFKPTLTQSWNFEFREIRRPYKTPFRYIDIRDSELIKGASILVAQTVTLHNTRFTLKGGHTVKGAGRISDAYGEASGKLSEWGYLIYKDPEEEQLRSWNPVCFVLASRSSISQNLGYSEYQSGSTDTLPIILDYSKYNQNLRSVTELSYLMPEAMRNQIITLPQRYLNNNR